jgi:hypothetical protein
LAFHPYPQLIPRVFNPGGFGPPHGLTRASPWPWVDHPASGPHHATTALFRLAFAPATPQQVNLATQRNSQAHSSKGTPSHTQRHALTACRHTVSGTLSLPSRGTFHHSLTVLSTIGHQEVFRLSEWPRQIHSTQHGNAATREHHHTPHTSFHLRDSHPLRPAIPNHSANLCMTLKRKTASSSNAPQPRTRNPCPVSHAHGLAHIRFRSPLLTESHKVFSSPAGTKMFHFPAFPPTPYTFKRR